MKKTLLFVMILLTFSFMLDAVESPLLSGKVYRIGFFKTISDSSDISTISLTQNLYFSKISMLHNFAVDDYRETSFSLSDVGNYPDLDFVFYTEIQENGSGWTCTFHGMNTKSLENFSATKNYDSYYMILMDAKNELTSFLDNMTTNQKKEKTQDSESPKSDNNIISDVSIEDLSGTWNGEDFIDQIVLLRGGGRGFVIFQNGASMNISVTVEDNKLIATQTSKPNASFFPEISRAKALELAPSAKPIQWTLNINSLKELEGTKFTLVENTPGQPEFGSISVKWTRQ